MCPAASTSDGGLPARSLPCLGGGRRVDLSTLKGPLVINFWNAACAPCRSAACLYLHLIQTL